jgi:hypothetical protein
MTARISSGFCEGVVALLAAPADAARADGNRPVIEEIAADRHFVAAVVVLPGVMGFKGDGEQVVHKRFPFKRSGCGSTRRANSGVVDWHMLFPDGVRASAHSSLLDLGEGRFAYAFVLSAPPVALEQVEGLGTPPSRG